MTQLKANGWHINTNGDNRIELVRNIDKGEFATERITAEKKPRSNCWELTIVETSNDGSRENPIKPPETFPADARDQVVATINEYIQNTPTAY